MPRTVRCADARTARVPQLTIDPERLQRVWAMSPDQRCQAARQGQLSLGEMLRWAARMPQEVPLVNGEFFFIAAHSADHEA
jgi:hypothetical protein